MTEGEHLRVTEFGGELAERVLAHDRNPRDGSPTTGTCTLADGLQGTYTFRPH